MSPGARRSSGAGDSDHARAALSLRARWRRISEMDLSDAEIAEGVALNEARLIGVQVTDDRRTAWITLGVLSLPSDGWRSG